MIEDLVFSEDNETFGKDLFLHGPTSCFPYSKINSFNLCSSKKLLKKRHPTDACLVIMVLNKAIFERNIHEMSCSEV